MPNTRKKRAQNKRYYIADPDKKKAASRASYKASPEKKRAASRASYKADPDKRKAASRASYKASPEKKRAASRASYKADTVKTVTLSLSPPPFKVIAPSIDHLSIAYMLYRGCHYLSVTQHLGNTRCCPAVASLPSLRPRSPFSVESCSPCPVAS